MKSRPILPTLLVAALSFVTAATPAHAQSKKPTSKMYVADTQGDTEIDNGKEIDDLTKKTVYSAEGTIIETKNNSNASAVLSNGTGIYFDVNTRVQVRDFQQDAFRPNRTDIDDEPSVSTTRIILDYGVIGISTSKMVAGSKMVFETSLATAYIRGRQSVIKAADNLTVISMVQGDATVQAGPMNAPHVIQPGQQIIVRPPSKPGEPNSVLIQEIPPGTDEEAQIWLNERVLTADAARKLVYFEVQARGRGDGSIALFDGSANPGSDTEIVAVPVVSSTPPIGPVISAANLSSH